MDELEKLYNGLSERGLYTKTLEEFRVKYNTPETQQKLYEGLAERGLYTKDFEQFKSKYFPEKKNVGESSSIEPQSVSSTTTNGSSDSPQGSVDEMHEKGMSIFDTFTDIFDSSKGDLSERLLKAKTAHSVLRSDLWHTLKASAARTASSFTNLPDATAKIMIGMFGDDESLEKFNAMSQEEKDLVVGGLPILAVGNVPISSAEKVTKDLNEFKEEVEKKKLKFNQNIVSDIDDGNFLQAAYRTVNGLVDSAPSLAITAVPAVGIPALIGSSISQQQQESEEEGRDVSAQESMNMITKGTVEGLFEIVTRKMLKGAFKGLTGNKKASQEMAENTVQALMEKSGRKNAKDIIKGFAKEGGSEAGTELVQSLSDSFFRGEELDIMQTLRNMGDAGLIGGIMGGGIVATGKAVDALVAPVKNVNPEQVDVIEDTDRDVLQQNMDMLVKNGELTQDEADNVLNNYDEINANLQQVPETYSSAKKAKAVNLLQQRTIIEKQIAGKDDNLVESQKARIEEINEQLKQLPNEPEAETVTENDTTENVEVEQEVDETPEQLAERVIAENATKVEELKTTAQKHSVTQKTYKDFVKEIMKAKMMPEFAKTQLNKVLSGMEKSKTNKTLIREIDKVTEVMYDMVSRRKDKDITRELKKSISRKQSGRVKATTLAPQQAIAISDIRDEINLRLQQGLRGQRTKEHKQQFLVDHMSVLQGEIESLIDELANAEGTSDRGISMVEDISNQIIAKRLAHTYATAMNAETNRTKSDILDTVLDEIKDIRGEGRDRLQEMIEQRKENKQNYLSQAREETFTGKEVLNSPQELSNRRKNVLQSTKRLLFRLFSGENVADLRSIFRIISKKGNEDAEGGYLLGDLYPRLIRAETNKVFRIRKKLREIQKIYRKIYGGRVIADAALAKRFDFKVKRENSEGDMEDVEITLTRGQMIKLYMDYFNVGNRKHFEKSGLTPEVMENIESKLTDSDKKYADELFKFYDSHWNDVNKVYEKMYMFPMGKQPHYAGKIYVGDNFNDEVNLLDNTYVSQTTAGGSTKQRTNKAGQIKHVSANQALLNYLKEMEHFINYAEIHREYNDVVNDQAFKANVMENDPAVGDLMLNMLNYYKQKDMERGGNEKVAMKVLNNIAGNIVRGTLALKGKIGVIQTISFMNGLTALPNETKYWTEGFNPKNMVEALRNSEFIKNRWSKEQLLQLVTGLSDLDSGTMTPQTVRGAYMKQAWSTYQKIMQASMIAVKSGDMLGVSGALPSYGAWKAKYMEQGMSETEASEKAMKRLEAGIDSSQQTQTGFGKSPIQRSPLGRFFTMYLTAPLQNYRNTVHAFTELKRGMQGKEMKGSYTQNGMKLLNYGVAQPMLYTYLSSLLAGSLSSFFDDEDNNEKESDKALMSSLIMRNSNSIPVLGSIMQLVVEKGILDKEHSFGSFLSNPLFEEAERVTQLIERWKKAKSLKAKKNLEEQIFERATKVLLGFPSKQIRDAGDTYLSGVVKPDSKEHKEWLQIKDESDMVEYLGYLLGYSEFVIKQRQKERKLDVKPKSPEGKRRRSRRQG